MESEPLDIDANKASPERVFFTSEENILLRRLVKVPIEYSTTVTHDHELDTAKYMHERLARRKMGAAAYQRAGSPCKFSFFLCLPSQQLKDVSLYDKDAKNNAFETANLTRNEGP